MLATGGKGYVQAGGGIVADSVPELEYQESLNKAKTMMRAIERAREMYIIPFSNSFRRRFLYRTGLFLLYRTFS